MAHSCVCCPVGDSFYWLFPPTVCTLNTLFCRNGARGTKPVASATQHTQRCRSVVVMGSSIHVVFCMFVILRTLTRKHVQHPLALPSDQTMILFLIFPCSPLLFLPDHVRDHRHQRVRPCTTKGSARGHSAPLGWLHVAPTQSHRVMPSCSVLIVGDAHFPLKLTAASFAIHQKR